MSTVANALAIILVAVLVCTPIVLRLPVLRKRLEELEQDNDWANREYAGEHDALKAKVEELEADAKDRADALTIVHMQGFAEGKDAARAHADALAEALGWMLPMARGYAHKNDVGRNQEIVEHADERLAAYRGTKA